MAADLVRFEDFELDLRSYQVRRSGRTLRLERIPMEVLFLLAERRGQLVTREEIIKKLWGKDAFLDTDNAINTAIRKIRQVLKDDPEQPRFVQTITGKGYRFIGQIAEVVVPPAKAPAHESTGTRAPEETGAPNGYWKKPGSGLFPHSPSRARIDRRRLHLPPPAHLSSRTKTRLSSPISRTRRATPCSTAHCGKAWLCNSSNRQS